MYDLTKVQFMKSYALSKYPLYLRIFDFCTVHFPRTIDIGLSMNAFKCLLSDQDKLAAIEIINVSHISNIHQARCILCQNHFKT